MMIKQASARRCFVCGVENEHGLGLKFYETGPGEVIAEVTVPEHFQGYPGVVHGGIVASMLDEVAGRTLMGDVSPRFMVTARLTVRYRKPVPLGAKLVLKGHVSKLRL
ncbi:MAG TPA: PaaI family thioesterase [Anaerolineaceae bacterium]|nr:PaaI family thioesterase [Anaerolineaceae bacterium]